MNTCTNVSIKRLVFLRLRKHDLLGQVRDPLPHSSRREKTASRLTSLRKIGIIGTIDERKSIELAIASVELLGPKYQLFLVGQVSPSYKERLDQITAELSYVEVNDKHLTEKEMQTEISNLDCFLVLQTMNLPSGTLLRALDSGTPCVVGGARVLKAASKVFPNSVFWSGMTPSEVAQAIERASNSDRQIAEGIPTPSDFAFDLMK